MAIGPGKYDKECEEMAYRLAAEAVVLMVLNGTRGNGFSVVSTNVHVLAELPALLRSLASQIEADAAALLKPN